MKPKRATRTRVRRRKSRRARLWCIRSPTSTRSGRRPVLELERIGEKTADSLLAQIERSKAAPLARVLLGLGIRHVGERTAQSLADAFGSIDALIAATPEELTQINDIGRKVARSCARLLPESARNLALIERLRAAGLHVQGREARHHHAACGPDLRADRHAADADARGRQGADRSCGRQGLWHGVEEDELPGRGRRGRHRSSRRRNRWA